MHIPKWLYFGLATLAAGRGARAQTDLTVPLLAASEVRPAPAELLLQQQAAQHALELGLPAVAAELYRGLLAVSGGDRAALTLALATALLDDGRVDEAEQALQGIVVPRDAAWHLRAGLIAAVRKNFDVAQTEAAAVKPEELGPTDRGWYYFLEGQLADADGDAQKAQAFYDQAADMAASDQQRAQFALAKSQAELRAGPPGNLLVNELRDDVDKYQGTLTGYVYVRQYAVALDATGHQLDAVSLLQRQLQALPPAARAAADDFRLLLGLIAGYDTDPGRQALTELLSNGSDRAKQRIALQLLGRAAAQAGAGREAFLRLLDGLVGAAQPHPILEDLLLFRAQVNLADKAYGLAVGDAQVLLEKFPGSPLKPAALGVLLGVAWEQRRYRLAADYAAQARAALPAGETHAQLGVLVAEAWLRAGDFRNAADAYAAVLGERPAGVDAGALIFHRVQAEIEAGRLDTAQTLTDQFAGDAAFDAVNRWQAEWNLARALEAHGQTAAALARVDKLLGAPGAAALPAGSPESVDLRLRMAWLQARLAFEAGQPEQSLKLAGALADSLAGAGGAGVPADLKTLVISAELLQEAEADFALQRADAALALLKALRTDFPQSDAAVQSYIVEANFYADHNRLVDAQALLTKLADDFHTSRYAPQALYLAALNAERRGQDAYLEEANRLIERLVSEYPQSDLVFYARLKQGDLFRKLNRFGPAQQVYEYLANNYAQHPDALVARMALADCHSAQAANDPAHAESATAIYESLSERPDAPAELCIEAGCKLGLLQSQRGQTGDAQKTWWRLVNVFLLAPEKSADLGATGPYWMGRILFALGDSLEQQQQLDQAREAWQLIVRYKLPGEALAQERLARYLPAGAKL
jgi:outer membrane protein assembly factor BamD (BamD/ComL family)